MWKRLNVHRTRPNHFCFSSYWKKINRQSWFTQKWEDMLAWYQQTFLRMLMLHAFQKFIIRSTQLPVCLQPTIRTAIWFECSSNAKIMKLEKRIEVTCRSVISLHFNGELWCWCPVHGRCHRPTFLRDPIKCRCRCRVVSRDWKIHTFVFHESQSNREWVDEFNL